MSDLRAAFDDGPALVPYVVAGDPDVESTKDYVRALVRGGADVVELGLPFSEPIADGPTIQNAIRRALDGGMTPDRYLDLVADLDVDVPVVCMTYYNLIYRYGAERGVEEFVAAAADAGVAGLIVPDIPVEESGPLRAACDAHGLDLVFIVAPTTTPERVERILAAGSGFVYVQARLGTTGAREDVSDQTAASLARLDDAAAGGGAGADLPRAVGFGVSEGEHASEIVRAGADGVVAGSVFVDIIASGDEVDGRLEAKAAELAEGAAVALPKPERT
ncbi:tryptophan synthase subunit alpha [Halobacteriaceae archaeon GCM10025711]